MAGTSFMPTPSHRCGGSETGASTSRCAVRAIRVVCSRPRRQRSERKRLRDLQAKIEAEEAEFQAGAAIDALERWDRCPPAPADRGYLKSKGIAPCGVRIDGAALLVPMRDIDGKLWSLQEIWPDGRKHNQSGGRRKGCFFEIGEIGDTFIIGEGYSTCASIHMATEYAVMSAGEAGNLVNVAQALRMKYPAATIIICGDDDWLLNIQGKPKNVGKLAAQEAAAAIGGVLALPWFSSARPKWATDFNDQARLSGLDDVATTIRLAMVTHAEERERQRADEPPPPEGPEDFGLPLDGLAPDKGITLQDFYSYMPSGTYIFAPSREMWPAKSVNAKIPPIPVFDAAGRPVLKKGEQELMTASAWLDKHRSVEMMTWAPGMPELIQNRLISDGGFFDRDGVTTFNHYRPPMPIRGNPAKAGMWTDHVCRVFGDDADHIIYWLAQRVQQPHQKINHALVLGGSVGIGKDTLLEPVKRAIGPWNFAEVSPNQVLGRFNGFLKSVILRVSEARDLGDFDRFQLHDHMKTYIAAPPDVLRVDEKHLREYSVLNVTGVIITTNHKSDGIFLPPDDRRHFVAWSDLLKEDFADDYWNKFWRWYKAGGIEDVAAYLAAIDLSPFDPKAPPPKTPAFWAIVDASRAPEDAELADVLDALGNPKVLTLARIQAEATGPFRDWITDRKNSRLIPHRLDECGYTAVRNDGPKDGLWVLNHKRQVIYARKELSIRDRIEGAKRLLE